MRIAFYPGHILMHITLVSIDAKENRWRTYLVQIGKTGEGFTVTLSWGRKFRYKQKQVKHFDEEDTMRRFVGKVLRTRQLHGYLVFNKSDDFPILDIPQEMEEEEVFSDQLSLFENSLPQQNTSPTLS